MGWEPIVLYVIIGAGILVLFKFPFETFPFSGFLALSFWAGVLIVTFIVILLAIITGKLFFEIFWIVLILSVIALIRQRAALRHYFRLKDRLRHSREGKEFLLLLPLLVCILIEVFFVVSVATRFPIVGFDAVGNFGIKAKLWHQSRSLYPPDLLDSEYLMYKRRYPAVLPVTECIWSSVLGGWKGERIKFFFIACWLSVGLLVHAALRRREQGVIPWIGMSLWILLPFSLWEVFGGAIDGFGDIPFGIAMLAAIVAIEACYTSKNFRHIVLMGILIAGTFWVKKEGVPFVAAALLFLLWKRVPWRTIALVIAVSGIFYLVHIMATRNVPHFFEKDITLNISFSELLSRFKQYIVLTVRELNSNRQWGNKFWLILLFAWMYKIAFVRFKFLVTRELYFFLFMFAAYSLVFHLTLFDFSRVMQSTFDRLFIHIYPLLVIATLSGVTRREEMQGSRITE
jgi:hypothetical protein